MIRRDVAAGYAKLLCGEAVAKLSVLVAFAYLARVLGPSGLGQIELALSWTVVFVLTAESSLGSYGARVLAVEPLAAGRLVPQIMVLRALFVAPVFALLVLASRWMPAGDLMVLFGCVMLAVPFANQWVLQASGRMHAVALATALRYVVFAALVFAWVRPGSDLRLVAVAEIAGAAVFSIAVAGLVRASTRVRFEWAGAWRGAWQLIASTWFFAASTLLWACSWYAPTLLVGLRLTPRDTASIAAPLRIVLTVHTAVFLYFFNLLPRIASELSLGPERWRALVHDSLRLSMWAACFVAVTTTVMSPLIVRVLFGAGYEGAVAPLAIAIWMIPIAQFSGHFRFSLIAAGQQRLEARASAIGAATVVGLTLPLAAMAGPAGAAVAFVLGGLANAWSAWAAARKHIGMVAPMRQVPLAAVLNGRGADA